MIEVVCGVWFIIVVFIMFIFFFLVINWICLMSVVMSLNKGVDVVVLLIFNIVSFVGFGVVIVVLLVF